MILVRFQHTHACNTFSLIWFHLGSFFIRERASLPNFKVMVGFHRQSFVLLLFGNLCAKRGCHSVGFLRGVIYVTFWLAEAAWMIGSPKPSTPSPSQGGPSWFLHVRNAGRWLLHQNTMNKLKRALLFNRTTQNQYKRELISARNTFLTICVIWSYFRLLAVNFSFSLLLLLLLLSVISNTWPSSAGSTACPLTCGSHLWHWIIISVLLVLPLCDDHTSFGTVGVLMWVAEMQRLILITYLIIPVIVVDLGLCCCACVTYFEH